MKLVGPGIGSQAVPTPGRRSSGVRKAAARTFTDDELIYGVAIMAEIEVTTDRKKLRELWTREKDFHEMKVNGTTILDAINAKAATLTEETK